MGRSVRGHTPWEYSSRPHTGRVDLPIATRTLVGELGPLTVAASPRGVIAADWWVDADALRAGLRRRLGTAIGPPDDAADARLSDAIGWFQAALDSRPDDADGVAIDLADRPEFDQRVLSAVRGVGWGQTASYGEIARRVGAPRAARAVGGALGRNPISLLIPCHRIIASDGTLGGYGGDGPHDRAGALERKQALLLREGRTVRPRGT